MLCDAHIFGGQKLHAFGHLVREAEQVLGVQREAVLVKHRTLRIRLDVGATWEDKQYDDCFFSSGASLASICFSVYFETEKI